MFSATSGGGFVGTSYATMGVPPNRDGYSAEWDFNRASGDIVNVRQLRNSLERMLALRGEGTSEGSQLHLQMDITGEIELPEGTRPASSSPDVTHKVKPPRGVWQDDPADDGAGDDDEPITPYRDARRDALQSFEREYLERLMARAENNLSRAARIAGVDRKHIRNLLKKHDLYGG